MKTFKRLIKNLITAIFFALALLPLILLASLLIVSLWLFEDEELPRANYYGGDFL